MMRRVLVISSYVAKGTVGLQATLPAFANAGIEVIAVPTIMLSNHPGFKATAGAAIGLQTLDAIVDALDANGWLDSVAGVLSGYMPSSEHVRFARRTVERVKIANSTAVYLADPVIGDDPEGVYVDREAAIAIRDELLPLANFITPNTFELAWLTGRDVRDRSTAIIAAQSTKVPHVAVTSVPAGVEHLENVLVSGHQFCSETVTRLAAAPHGTGDYFAGAFLADLLHGGKHADALTRATRLTERLVLASQDRSDLVFAGTS